MKIGTGKSEIVLPPEFLPTEGFTRQYTPLYARCAVMSDQSEYAVLSLEMTSLPQDEIAVLKRIVFEETGVAHCFICVTHTFSAPHVRPDRLLETQDDRTRNTILKDAVHKAARASAADAQQNRQDVRLQLGQSVCNANINRDIETRDGWWVSNTGTGPSDKTMTVVCAENVRGEPVLALTHYAVQPSVLDGVIFPDGGKAVHGDLAGVLCEQLETHHPGLLALFLLGAAGDQAPVHKGKTITLDKDGDPTEHDAGEDSLHLCRTLGTQMAESALSALKAAKPLTETRMAATSEEFLLPRQKMRELRALRPTRNYQFEPDGELPFTAEAFCVGPVAFFGVKPELNCISAQQIAECSPFETTLVLTMVNGGAKYMADQESYDRCTYQAMNSPFGKGCAETLVERAHSLLKTLHTEKQ